MKKSLCYIQSLYLTTSHYFLHYVSYVFKYFILLLCIITFNIDYCYMYVLLLYTPSHVWPEFNKLLSIVYCLLSNRLFTQIVQTDCSHRLFKQIVYTDCSNRLATQNVHRLFTEIVHIDCSLNNKYSILWGAFLTESGANHYPRAPALYKRRNTP